jgi:hypothetical protein
MSGNAPLAAPAAPFGNWGKHGKKHVQRNQAEENVQCKNTYT